jgi:hypothetical protein
MYCSKCISIGAMRMLWLFHSDFGNKVLNYMVYCL